MTTFSQIVLTFLLNAAWQVVVIVSVAWLADKRLGKVSARYRHWLWVTALLLCLLLPLLSVARLWPVEEATATAREMVSLQVETGVAVAAPAASAFQTLLHNRPRTFSPTPLLTALALSCYLFSVLLHALKLWRAGRRTVTLLTRASERTTPLLLAEIKTRGQMAFGLPEILLRCSTEIAGPVTAGRRTILLPEFMFQSTGRSVLTAAVGHEMAHLKRHDFACNLLYEALSLPLAFHPAITFLKRQIKQTRELACDELVTETLLDAPTYARSLLVLAEAMTGFRRPNFSLGVFDAEILEERIMKLIKPRLQKRTALALSLAALLALLLSSALAAALSLNVEQSGAHALSGEWEMYWREDGKDPKGSIFEFPIGLQLRMTGDRLSGEAMFPRMIDDGSGPRKDGEATLPLLDLRYSNNQLTFKIEGDDKGDFAELKLQREGETFAGHWTILREKESGSIKMLRKPRVSQIEKIIGEWTVQVFNRDGEGDKGEGPLLIVKADGSKLTAKTILTMNGERKEWTLIDPHFDGETFLFKLDNGEELLEGKLKLVDDHFEGQWRGAQSGVSGTMKLLRKK